jgi:hypothetical protein
MNEFKTEFELIREKRTETLTKIRELFTKTFSSIKTSIQDVVKDLRGKFASPPVTPSTLQSIELTKIPFIVGKDNYLQYLNLVQSFLKNKNETIAQKLEKQVEESIEILKFLETNKPSTSVQETYFQRSKALCFCIHSEVEFEDWQRADFQAASKYETLNKKDLMRPILPSSIYSYISNLLIKSISLINALKKNVSPKIIKILQAYADYYKLLSKTSKAKTCKRITKMLSGKSKSLFGKDYSLLDTTETDLKTLFTNEGEMKTRCSKKFSKWKDVLSKQRCLSLVKTRFQLSEDFDENCDLKNQMVGGDIYSGLVSLSLLCFAVGCILFVIGLTLFPPLLTTASLLFGLSVFLFCLSLPGVNGLICLFITD